MNYVKKMCILRQIRQGFSGDGKALSGLIKIEQYGKNIAVEISIINFAPLASGEYYCLLSDGNGKTEMLALRGKCFFNLLTDLDVSGGFCGIICYVKNEVVPIAYGINGNKSYDWKTILNATLPPVFPSIKQELASGESTGNIGFSEQTPTPKPVYETPPEPIPTPPCPPKEPSQEPEPLPAPTVLPPQPREDIDPPKRQEIRMSAPYDDDVVAEQDYYKETEDGCHLSEKTRQNAHVESATEEQGKKTGALVTEDVDAPRIRDAIKTDPDGYYLAVKEEIDELFKKYPRDKRLSGAFSCSEWVRIKGTVKKPEYLVGVLRTDGKVRHICYALWAEDKDNPPAEIKNVCSFVPVSSYETGGYFVIFQSAATGECIRPERT